MAIKRTREEAGEKVSLIQEVVSDGRIRTRWQPICSIRKGCIIGVEALSMGFTAEGKVIPPTDLFAMAEEAAVKRLL